MSESDYCFRIVILTILQCRVLAFTFPSNDTYFEIMVMFAEVQALRDWWREEDQGTGLLDPQQFRVM